MIESQQPYEGREGHRVIVLKPDGAIHQVIDLPGFQDVYEICLHRDELYVMDDEAKTVTVFGPA